MSLNTHLLKALMRHLQTKLAHGAGKQLQFAMLTRSSSLAEAQLGVMPDTLQGQQIVDHLAMTKVYRSSLFLLILAFSKAANSKVPVVSCGETPATVSTTKCCIKLLRFSIW